MTHWTDFYPRRFTCGGSEAYVSARDMVVLAKPFTAGEDAVMAWCARQDSAVLVDIVPLVDGRDMIFLRRRHTQQNVLEALAEEFAHLHSLTNKDLMAT